MLADGADYAHNAALGNDSGLGNDSVLGTFVEDDVVVGGATAHLYHGCGYVPELPVRLLNCSGLLLLPLVTQAVGLEFIVEPGVFQGQ